MLEWPISSNYAIFFLQASASLGSFDSKEKTSGMSVKTFYCSKSAPDYFHLSGWIFLFRRLWMQPLGWRVQHTAQSPVAGEFSRIATSGHIPIWKKAASPGSKGVHGGTKWTSGMAKPPGETVSSYWIKGYYKENKWGLYLQRSYLYFSACTEIRKEFGFPVIEKKLWCSGTQITVFPPEDLPVSVYE